MSKVQSRKKISRDADGNESRDSSIFDELKDEDILDKIESDSDSDNLHLNCSELEKDDSDVELRNVI